MNTFGKIGALALFVAAPYFAHELPSRRTANATVQQEELCELGKLEDYEGLLPGIGKYKGSDGSLTPEGAKRYFFEVMDNGDGKVSCPELTEIYNATMILEEKRPLPGNKYEDVKFTPTRSGQSFKAFFIDEYHKYMAKIAEEEKRQCRLR